MAPSPPLPVMRPPIVRKVRSHGNVRYMVNWHANGKRHREKYESKRQAEARREEIQSELESGGEVWFGLAPKERSAFGLVLKEMDAAGAELAAVWSDWKA